jgi:hypothetical protein
MFSVCIDVKLARLVERRVAPSEPMLLSLRERKRESDGETKGRETDKPVSTDCNC